MFYIRSGDCYLSIDPETGAVLAVDRFPIDQFKIEYDDRPDLELLAIRDRGQPMYWAVSPSPDQSIIMSSSPSKFMMRANVVDGGEPSMSLFTDKGPLVVISYKVCVATSVDEPAASFHVVSPINTNIIYAIPTVSPSAKLVALCEQAYLNLLDRIQPAPGVVSIRPILRRTPMPLAPFIQHLLFARFFLILKRGPVPQIVLPTTLLPACPNRFFELLVPGGDDNDITAPRPTRRAEPEEPDEEDVMPMDPLPAVSLAPIHGWGETVMNDADADWADATGDYPTLPQPTEDIFDDPYEA